MEAGALRHRVRIQYKVVVRDAYGGETITWTDADTVYAEVLPGSGGEGIDGKAVEATLLTRVRMRYRDDITIQPERRLVWGSHTYDIRAVQDVDGRQRELVLTCEEVVGR